VIILHHQFFCAIRWFEEEMHSQASQGYIEKGKENDITHPPHSPVLQCKQSAQSTADHNKKGWRESTKERDAFSFPRVNFSFKTLYL